MTYSGGVSSRSPLIERAGLQLTGSYAHAWAATSRLDCCRMSAPMLDLTLVRGPLTRSQNQEILSEVNRLTQSRIPLDDFCRWVQDSPEGPAFHSMLQHQGRIVGHFCLIPLRLNVNGVAVSAARTEYFFLHEDFRTQKVRGFEDSFLSPAILLLDELYRHSSSCGYGPFLVSAAEDILPLHELVGCQPVDFSLHECLFVLRPWLSARQTPNIGGRKRLGLFLCSVIQAGLWAAAKALQPPRPSIGCNPYVDSTVSPTNGGISLFEDSESRNWRFSEEDYILMVDKLEPASYLIAKKGSDHRYLRVCQWHLHSPQRISQFVGALLHYADSQRMLGLRWALFGQDQQSKEILRILRRHAFLCVPRVRRLLIYDGRDQYFEPSAWRLSDALFCFDH